MRGRNKESIQRRPGGCAVWSQRKTAELAGVWPVRETKRMGKRHVIPAVPGTFFLRLLFDFPDNPGEPRVLLQIIPAEHPALQPEKKADIGYERNDRVDGGRYAEYSPAEPADFSA